MLLVLRIVVVVVPSLCFRSECISENTHYVVDFENVCLPDININLIQQFCSSFVS